MHGRRPLPRHSSCSARSTGRARSPAGRRIVSVMKARCASPDALVDLNGLEELKGIELGDARRWARDRRDDDLQPS